MRDKELRWPVGCPTIMQETLSCREWTTTNRARDLLAMPILQAYIIGRSIQSTDLVIGNLKIVEYESIADVSPSSHYLEGYISGSIQSY